MMAITSSVAWLEVLHTYEVLPWLNIYYGMDGQVLKSHNHTRFRFATHNSIRVEMSHIWGRRGGRMPMTSSLLW